MRQAHDAADIDHVVRMVVALREAISGPVEPDPAHIGETVLRLMHSPDGVVFVTDGGFLAGEVLQGVVSPARIAVEHGWFARDRSGLRLLTAFEAWAAGKGCAGIRMSAPPGNTAMQRRGYRAVETVWWK